MPKGVVHPAQNFLCSSARQVQLKQVLEVELEVPLEVGVEEEHEVARAVSPSTSTTLLL